MKVEGGEHPNGRKAMDRLAKRILDESRKSNRKTLTHEQARDIARDSARRHEHRRKR